MKSKLPAIAPPRNLRCNFLVNPLGLDSAQPDLSWQLTGRQRGLRQTACQVQVATSRQKLANNNPDVWDSGKQSRETTFGFRYSGRPAEERERLWWRVCFWDGKDRQSPFSQPSFWEAGLRAPDSWQASWIGSPWRGGPRTPAAAPSMRREFLVNGKVRKARLYVTALGVHETTINGSAVSPEVLAPGWTDYNTRVPYSTYDVTALLKPGSNCLASLLGDGWYCGHIFWSDRQRYGPQPLFHARLEWQTADGKEQFLVTDSSWKCQASPVLENDLLMGESYDARLEQPGWNLAGYEDQNWWPVQVFPAPGIAVSERIGPPVVAMEEITPVADPVLLGTEAERQLWLFDFGINLVGRVRLCLRAPAGTTVIFRHGEMLDDRGRLYTENLRKAKATDAYTFRGNDEEEVWEPRFTFHGFRYVEMALGGVEPTRESLTAVVLASDIPATGQFSCSDPLLNQLQANIVRGQLGNFLEVPTDCPQRDERLGWTGDAQVFARTASFNRDVAAFFRKWQRDLVDAQTQEGSIPSVAPNPRLDINRYDGGPAWADAFVLCPWTMYEVYGDLTILEESYPHLERWMESLARTCHDHIRVHPMVDPWGGFGDWLALDGSGRTDGGTPKDLIGTAFYAQDASLMANIASLLGKPEKAAFYKGLRQVIESAFQKRFLTADGLVAGGTQTALVLTLAFDLAPLEMRETLVASLVSDIRKRGHHLGTGFVGTPYLPFVLSRFGCMEMAYTLLMQKTWPSWLYPVTQGATTIWERWDGWTKEKGFQDPGMNSFNHYAYGCIGAWMYSVVAGLDWQPGSAGYSRLQVYPRPGGGLSHASASLLTMHGKAEVAWKINRREFLLNLTVPPCSTAEVHLPTESAQVIQEGGVPVAKAEGVTLLANRSNGVTTFQVTSGSFAFSLPLSNLTSSQ